MYIYTESKNSTCNPKDGCQIDSTHKICKLNNADSYNKIILSIISPRPYKYCS